MTKPRICYLALPMLLCWILQQPAANAQLPLYVDDLDVQITNIITQMDCLEGNLDGINNDPEPYVLANIGYSGGNFGPTYTYAQPNGAPCGTVAIGDHTTENFNMLCGVTEVSIQLEAWEEDCTSDFGTSGGTTGSYDNDCCIGFYAFGACIGVSNEDDDYVNEIVNYDFQANIPEGTTNNITFISTGNFAGIQADITWSSVNAVNVTGDLIVCSGETTTLTASHTGAVTATNVFNWYSDMGRTNLLFTGTNYNVSPSSTTTYYVTEVFGGGACESLPTSVTVTVSGFVAAPTVTSPVSACVNDMVELNASGLGSVNWYSAPAAIPANLIGTGTPFMFGPVTGSTTVYAALFDGTCESTTVPVVINAGSAPAPPTVTSPVSTCPGGFAVLTASGSGGDLTWYFDAAGTVAIGTGSPFNSPTINSATQTFYVSETDPVGGCESTLVPVIVNTDLVVTPPSPITEEICVGETATLNAFSGLLGGTYTWYSNSALTNIAYIGNPFTTPVQNTATTVTYYAVNSVNGCESTATPMTVIVNPRPNNPTAANVSICTNESATLTAAGSGGDIFWYADVAGNNLLNTTSSNTYVTPNLSSNTTYYVQEVNADGCSSDLVPVMVEILPVPPAPSTIGTTLCEGETGTIQASTTQSAGNFNWYDAVGNPISSVGIPPSSAQLSVGPFTPGTYIYYVSYDNGTCESNWTDVTVVVNSIPNTPNLMDMSTCEGGSVTISGGVGVYNFYDAMTGGTLLGTGSSYTTNPLTMTTSFYVSQIVNGCESLRDEVVVSVAPGLPMPSASSNAPVCEGGILQLNTDANVNYTYSWTGPNGFISSDQNPQIINSSSVLNSGIYQIEVTDINTGCTATNTVLVEVLPSPQSVPLFTNSPVCEGNDIILSAGTVGSATYTWFDQAGAVLGTTPTPEFIISNATTANTGSYSVVIEVNGCISPSSSALVDVVANPAAPIASNNSPSCEGGSVTVSVTPVSGATYTWTGPNNFSASSASFVLSDITTAEAGTYSVVVDVNGCVSTAATTNVVVTTSPVITAALSSNAPLCEGEDLILTAATVSGVDYQWSGPGGFSSSDQNPMITNVSEGDNQGVYTLVITDQATGCSSSAASIFVQIDATPSGAIATNSGSICEGGTINLYATSINNATYNWTGPNGFSSIDQNPVLTNATTDMNGTYDVEISVGDCAGIPVSTIVNVLAVPIVDAGADVEILQGESYVLTATGAVSYLWSPAAGLSNVNVPNPVFEALIPGTYTFTVTGFNGNQCSATDEITITVLQNNNLEFVDLITPNNDGVNDTWKIRYLENIKDNYTLKIYARGGVELLSTNAYANDWDGTYEGNELPDGTYWFVLKETDGVTYKGAITIKR